MTLRRLTSWHVTIGETDDGRLWAGCQSYDGDKHDDLLPSEHWTSATALFLELLTLLDTSLFTFLAGTDVGQAEEFRDVVA